MVQYRIVEKYASRVNERRFYPQIKKRFVWRSLKVSKHQTIENFDNTFEDAKEFILSRMPKVLFHCVEHPESREPKVYHINLKP